MESYLHYLPFDLAELGLNVLTALIVLLLGRWVAKGVRAALRKGMERAKVDVTLISFVCSLCYAALLAFVVISALSQLGIPTASFVAVVGAAGLAVGLALQGSLSNFASGVLLILFKPFKVGDFVEAGGTAGIVEEIGIFNTEMKTPDNKKIIVPNASITGSNITNITVNPLRRIDIVVGVSYQDDLDHVRKVLEGILADEDRILDEPAPTIGVVELAESSVNFCFRPWVKSEDWWATFLDVNEEIKKRFDREGISFPFPQRDVHIHPASPEAQ